MEVRKCAVCGMLSEALHVCQACRREACEDCFEPAAGVCTDCRKRLSAEAPVSSLPMKLFLSGFVLMFTGIVLMVAASILYGASSVSGGAVLIIGPIPIILGFGPYSFLAILLAVALTIFWLIFFFTLRKKG